MELPDSGVKRTGAMLAAARAAAGLELTDVARETRVPLRHLRALEADAHDELPALPYAIGFVKSFARAVGLDPEATAGQFRAETSKSAHVPAPLSLEPLDERRLPSRGLVFASAIAVIAVIAGLSAWGAGMFDPAPPSTTVAAAAVAGDATVTSADGTTADGTTADGPGVDGAPSDAGIAAVPVPAGLAAAGATATGPVVLTAKEEVWVKIYDKTTRVSAKIGIMQPGETYAVPADQPGLSLWTGKAGALDVSVGGKLLPPLGGPVETVRDVSLAAADLVARAAPVAPGATPTGPRPIATIPGA